MSETTQVTKDEIKDYLLNEIANEKQQNPQKDIIELAKERIENGITQKQLKEHREIICELYKELAATYTEQKTAFLKLARENNPYLITNLNNFDRYLKSYNEKNNYTCRIFPKSNYEQLVFAPGTIGFIGARTSRGKTTALVSIAIDALQQNKKVLFITMEESEYQLEKRFILNLLYAGGYYPEQPNMNVETWNTTLKETKFNSKRTLTRILQKQPIEDCFNDKDLTKQFMSNAFKAKEQLNDYLTSGQLSIYNGMESPTFELMLDAMCDNEEGTICLLDYAQKVKAPKEFAGIENRFGMLQKASTEIANATKRTNIITICGAQFGRSGEKAQSNVMDLFTDESFQECSAIEQAGEIEIGIGRHFNKGTKHTYYAILKDRDNGEYNPSIYYEIDNNEKFSRFTAKRIAETKDDGKTYENLIEYYNQDKDVIAGETTQERNNRIYGKKRYRKQDDEETNETAAETKNTAMRQSKKIEHGDFE